MFIHLSRLCLGLRLLPAFKSEARSPGSVGVEPQRNQEKQADQNSVGEPNPSLIG